MKPAFHVTLFFLLSAALIAGCAGGEKNTVQNTPSTLKDTSLSDSDLPLIEEKDNVDIGDVVPESGNAPADEEPETNLSDNGITLIEEDDTVEIGEML